MMSMGIIRKIFLAFTSISLAALLHAQAFSPVDNGSSVKFSIKNFGLQTTGSFSGLKGTIKFNPANPAAAVFNVSVDAGTINTGISSRDHHLIKDDYFDVEKYPVITFASSKITASEENKFVMFGSITIKGITKEISFPFTVSALSNGNLFAGEFKLNRRDFNVGSSSFVLSDNLTVSLSVFAKKVNH